MIDASGIVVCEFHAGHVRALGCRSGQYVNPSLVLDAGKHGGGRVVVIAVNAPYEQKQSVLLDADDYFGTDGIADITWYAHVNGYAYGRNADGKCITMHGMLMDGSYDKVASPDLSIDHIDRCKLDNRRVNLRVATQSLQNANRVDRSDRGAPPPELLALGIRRLPRYVVWDARESKFSFHDHPLVSDGTNPSGTKSAAVSVVNKFRHCLQMLTPLLERNVCEKTGGGGIVETLTAQYDAFVRAAHLHAPDTFADGPYIAATSGCYNDDELGYCRSLLADVLPQPQAAEVLHGRTNQGIRIVELPHLRAVAQVKGNGDAEQRVTLYDAALAQRFASLPKWDVTGSSPYVPLTADFRRMLAAANLPVSGNKVPLKDVVWTMFLGRELPPGHTVAPLNFQQYDLRAENLVLLQGEAKNYRAPARFELPAITTGCNNVMEGMRFMPRGLSASVPKTSTARVCIVFNQSAGAAFGTSKIEIKNTASAVATGLGQALAVLRKRDDGFDARNVLYQRLLGEYFDVALM
jgi:hypothetical protein